MIKVSDRFLLLLTESFSTSLINFIRIINYAHNYIGIHYTYYYLVYIIHLYTRKCKVINVINY